MRLLGPASSNLFVGGAYLLGPFFKSIIVTYPTFTTPKELLEGLLTRFSAPQDADSTAKLSKFRTSVVIKYWLKNHFADFDDSLIHRLLDICDDFLPSVGMVDLSESIVSTISIQVPSNDGSIEIIFHISYGLGIFTPLASRFDFSSTSTPSSHCLGTN